MGTVRVLFVGASRAVGLLERFRTAAKGLGAEVEIFACEDAAPWHPIVLAGLARHVPAPPFDDPGFEAFLTAFVRDHAVDIVIPAVDEATVVVARASGPLIDAGALPICSSLEVCEAMIDKRQADLLFRSLGLRVPSGRRFPLLAKPRHGSGSRGIVVLHDAGDLDSWRKRNRVEWFVLQPFVTGREFSIDGYVDASGRILGLVSRLRIALSGGEVLITRTERNDDALALAEGLLQWGKWHGPLTVQVVHDERDAYLLECNPRFGSGATCSIEAGLAMPEWILRERLGLPLPASQAAWEDGLCMSRSWQDHFWVPRSDPGRL